MKRILLVLFMVLTMLPLTISVFADTSMDGTWRIKESLCGYYSGYKSCGNDTSTVVISDNMVYSNDEYIGSVSVSGNTVFFNYSEDYLKSSIEESLQDSGYDAEVQSANVTYRGLLSGNKINNGKIRGNVKCLIQGYTINIKYKGTFKARRKE